MVANDIVNFNKKIEQNKDKIIQAFIDYYGLEYSDIIKDRFDKIYFDFSSKPEEEYIFVCSHEDEISEEIKQSIYSKCEEYIESDEKAREENNKRLINYIEEKLSIKISDMEKISKLHILSAFTDYNLNEGLIDSYSTESFKILNDPFKPTTIKESIIKDQERLYNTLKLYDIDIKPTRETADEIIEYRNKLKFLHEMHIVNNSYFVQLMDDIEDKFSFRLSPGVLCDIFLSNNSTAYTIGRNGKCYSIIKVPLLQHINNNIIALDVNVIHEIIHEIETNKNRTGIQINEKDGKVNNAINEILTEMSAKKITTKLHDMGVYIFDDPSNCKIYEQSVYEGLFPITEEFIGENDSLFRECSINNNPEKLERTFGEHWKSFSELLDSRLKEIIDIYINQDKFSVIQSDEKINDAINNMRSFSVGGEKHV